MKRLVLFLFFVCSSVALFATPPELYPYDIEVTEASDQVIEATVIKRDTIVVSYDEAYWLFTLEKIHTFKNRTADTGKTVQLLVKRDLPEERMEVLYASGTTYGWNTRIGEKYIFFIRKGTPAMGLENFYLFAKHQVASHIYFTPWDNWHKAHGNVHFGTLPDLYQYIQKLPGTSVPDSLMDPKLYRKETVDPWKDPVFLQMLEERKQKRLKQRQQQDSSDMLLQERLKRVQKKTLNRTEAAENLEVRLSNPTFIYLNTGYTQLEYDIELKASALVYLDNFAIRIAYNNLAFGPNIEQGGILEVLAYPFVNNSTYDPPAVKDVSSNVFTIALGLSYKTLDNWYRSSLTTEYQKVLRIKMIVSDCSQSADIHPTDFEVPATVCLYSTTADAKLSDVLYNFAVDYQGTVNPVMCKPNVLNVFPQSVTAGTNSKITIEGFGFGASRGQGAVVLKNADDNGASKLTVNDAIDVISWSDTKIEYVVPSVIKGTNEKASGCSGSGNVSIRES